MQRMIDVIEKDGLPVDFDRPNEAYFEFDVASGQVRLINDNFQYAVMRGDKLESYLLLPSGDDQGFLNELLERAGEHTEIGDLAFLMGIMEYRDLDNDDRYHRLDEIRWEKAIDDGDDGQDQPMYYNRQQVYP